MDTATMKNKIVETVQALPDDATVEDAMERLLFLAKLERGLREADGGSTVSHAEIKKRFLK
jgi:predicted transcriptional regulator